MSETDILLDPDAAPIERWCARMVKASDSLGEPTTRAFTGLAVAGLGGAVVAGLLWDLSPFLGVILGVIMAILPLALWGSIEHRGRAVMTWCEDSALIAIRARADALRDVHERLRAQLRALPAGSAQVLAVHEQEFESRAHELERDLWRSHRLSIETAQASADLARHARGLGFRLDRLLELAQSPHLARGEHEQDLVENVNLGPVATAEHTLRVAQELARTDRAQLEAGLAHLAGINERLETLLLERRRNSSSAALGPGLASSHISDPRLLDALVEDPPALGADLSRELSEHSTRPNPAPPTALRGE